VFYAIWQFFNYATRAQWIDFVGLSGIRKVYE